MSIGCSGGDDEPAEVPPVDNQPKWHLLWQDDFDGPEIDETVWSRIPQGTADWQKYQTTDPDYAVIRDGKLVLIAKVNDNTDVDPRPYLCGGVWTSGKKGFAPGSIQVKARLGSGAQGAWPAIWMMPFAPTVGWPNAGEIDIMERLNHETAVYSTVHSGYTYTLGIKDPANSVITNIDPTVYHVFEAQVWVDRVDFYIDGKLVLRYPKVNDGARGQFPFYTDWDIRLDMQLGGSWVGNVNSGQLPAEMEVDWVKYYQYY